MVKLFADWDVWNYVRKNEGLDILKNNIDILICMTKNHFHFVFPEFGCEKSLQESCKAARLSRK